jgi:hypothetical protein
MQQSKKRSNDEVSVKMERSGKQSFTMTSNLFDLLTINVFLQYSDTDVIQGGNICPAFTTFDT